MVTEEGNLPVLDAEAWLHVVDNTEQGEEIDMPFGLLPLMKGSTTALGAQTKVGKTAAGLQSFRWMVERGVRAIYCTLEMSPALLFRRFWPQFGSEDACRQWIEHYNPEISHSFLDYQEVEAIIRSGYEVAILDHIHQLPFDGHEDLARKVHRIAALAPETNTAILMLAQMKQPNDFHVGPPGIYDFSWTKAIPEVVGVAQALWIPDTDTKIVELITLANRYGPTNDPISLRLDPATITFERSLG